jgi:glycosyltransferase involved in cell wall biosynthesis
MKTAIVYDRVNKWGGAEKVLLTLHEIFPDAPLYTAVLDIKTASWAKVFPRVIPSFLQKIPILKKHHELLGWLTPLAFESFNFDKFDLVISVTSEAAKGIITKPKTKHICYCLTPTRYLWSGYNEYLNNPSSKLSWIPFYKIISQPFLIYAKYWDKIAAHRPDIFIAISTAVKERIKKYYNVDSKLIFPPVEINKFSDPSILPIESEGNYYLFVSRLIPYKKADIAIQAFNQMGKKLIVVGNGSEAYKLKKMSASNIKFISYLSDQVLAGYYKGAKALIFPGEEDFGIVMVESLAAGTPVIAYAKGGSLDIVEDYETGILFDNQSVSALICAVNKIEKTQFDKVEFYKNIVHFSKERFKKEILELVNT